MRPGYKRSGPRKGSEFGGNTSYHSMKRAMQVSFDLVKEVNPQAGNRSEPCTTVKLLTGGFFN